MDILRQVEEIETWKLQMEKAFATRVSVLVVTDVLAGLLSGGLNRLGAFVSNCSLARLAC